MAVTTLVEVVKSGGGDLEKRELSKSDMGRGSCVFVFRSSSSNEQRGRTVRVRKKRQEEKQEGGKRKKDNISRRSILSVSSEGPR